MTTERPGPSDSGNEVGRRHAQTAPSHLFNPNYYRLAHQLVAEYANRAAAIMLAPGTAVSQTSLITDGLHETSARLAEIGAVLADFTERHGHSTFWVINPPLKNQELRLQLFLSGTVDPCMRLIAAGFDAMDGRSDPQTRFWHQAKEPRQVPKVQRRVLADDYVLIRWSPRALYNLACFYSLWTSYGNWNSRHVDEGEMRRLAYLPAATTAPRMTNPGLWALQQALRRSQGHERALVVGNALSDPTLQPLLDDPEVGADARAAIARYSLPEPGRDGGSDAAGERHPAPLSPKAFRAFQVAQQQADWDLQTAKGVLDDGRELAKAAKDRFDGVDGWLRIGPSERRDEAPA